MGAVRRFGLTWSRDDYPTWIEAEAARRDKSPSELMTELLEAAIDTRR